MNARELITHLKGVKKSGAGWTARCPAHDDKHNSLSVSDGDDGRLLLKCHTGCEFESILAAVSHTNGNRREVAAYDYRDQNGVLLYQSVRFEPKGFLQRRPSEVPGEWVWNLNGGRVLYRLAEILQAKPEQTILIVEGEKDADRLAALGLAATTNSAGAGKWRAEYSDVLRGRKVAILPDNDEPGRAHALHVATSLQGIAASIKIVELPGLPPKGDVSDWLDAGGSLRTLRDLVNKAAEFVAPLDQSKAKTSPPRFNLTTLDDLLAEAEEETAYVWDRALPCGGFSILAAKPKVGKSTFARALARAVSRGEAFFDRLTRKGKVIILCLEEKRAEIKKDFQRTGVSGNEILIYTGKTPVDAISVLESAIAEHSPVLVIIDPLSRFIRVADFNSYAEVARQLEPLIDIARVSTCGTHILALHHNGKGGDLREGGDAVLGSSAIFAAVDALLTMRKREKVRTIESTQRYGEDLPETIVHLDSLTGAVTAVGDMKDFTLSERKKLVLESIGSEPLSEAAIKDAVGGTNKGLTSKALRALFDEGQVTRTGGGKRGDAFMYQIARDNERQRFEPKFDDPARQAAWDAFDVEGVA